MSTRTSTDPRRRAREPARRLEPVHPRHPDVHQHQGGPLAGRATAWAPSSASPTTSKSSSSASSARNPRRNTAWSSAISSRTVSSRSGRRERGGHVPAAVRRRTGVDLAADRGGALAHPEQAAARCPPASGAAAPRRARRARAGRSGGRRSTVTRRRPRVLERVAERLLDDPERRGLDRGRRRRPGPAPAQLDHQLR